MTANLTLSNPSLIGALVEGEEQILPVDVLCRRFRVDALIRLHHEDYAGLEGLTGRFVHFNLEVTLNEASKRYAILPILRAGHRDATGREVLPLVDIARHRIGRCEDVRQRVPIRAVPEHCLASSLPSLRSLVSLEDALIRRYAPMFPELTRSEILSRGCAITTLMLE